MQTIEASPSFTALGDALGHSFIVHTQSGPQALVLTKAVELPRRGLPEQFRTPLLLVFSGPVSPLLAQGSYVIDHPGLGRNEWVLVPVSNHAVAGIFNDTRPAYEVIFN